MPRLMPGRRRQIWIWEHLPWPVHVWWTSLCHWWCRRGTGWHDINPNTYQGVDHDGRTVVYVKCRRCLFLGMVVTETIGAEHV